MYKIFDSLHYTPKTNISLYVNYISIIKGINKKYHICLVKYFLPGKNICIINTWHGKLLDGTLYSIFAFKFD